MYKGHKISVVLPCYNEEEGIRIVMGDMPAFVDEVIAVDNNSVDRTSAVARELGAVVVPESRQGYGAAYKAGFRSASGDVIVAMDADGTYPRSFIPVILDVMFELDLDFITCDRTGHKLTKSSPLRVFGNWVLGVAMNLLFGMRVHDSQSGMWVFKRSILPQLRLTSDGMAFSEELKIEAFTKKHLRAEELPIYYRDRAGESKLSPWRDGFRNLVFLLKMRFVRRAPLPQVDPESVLTDTAK
jgi:glycosyltransferase involved in cell wall biosynthesis